jgi:amino acid adenylation domain-containing protein
VTAAELISHLHSLDVKLWLDGDRLRYSAPRGVMSQALLKELAENKAAVCEFLNRAQGVTLNAPAPVLPIPRDGDLALSFAQQRLWLINQLAPGSSAYNVATALRLQGPLNVAALEQALEEIVRRHEVLRTIFAVAEGRPTQVIKQSSGRVLPVVDLLGLTETAREACGGRLAAQHGARLFQLSEGPLLLAALLRLSADEHMLLLTMHHIVSDGWSIGVLTREALSLYSAFSAGLPSPLEELPVQYADYAAWQRRWLDGGALPKQLAYWKQQLADHPSALELPTDRPRPAVQTYKGAAESFIVSREVADGLKALGRREGATLFMVLLAAFDVLLYRYTGQEDICVGTPVAGRTRPELERLIGFFVNTLVLRMRTDGAEGFDRLLRRVREVTLGAYVNQDVPFEKLVEELQPERDPSRSALFQVMLVLQNAPREALDEPGLKVSRLEAGNRTAKFDLTLEVDDGAPELRCLFEYNTDLFEAATIRRMAAHFQTILEGVVRSPERPTAGLPLLTPEERCQLLFGWNDTAADHPSDKAVQELFEAQVERTPEAVALVAEGWRLTYRELNARANRLARYLRRGSAVGPEALVGVCVERSAEMVVALLAVLKAGGAYVPIDPTYPRERVAYLLADSRTPVLLTQAALADGLRGHGARVMCLDADWPEIERESPEPFASGVTGDNLVYVIYTSGSTGRPKGAMNTHRAVCNRLLWMQRQYGLTPDDCVLQKTPFGFDVSVWEFFWPLMTGARLAVARPGGHQDAAYLVETIEREQVTTLHFVPSMLHIFLEEQGHTRCPSLRRVICSGETLPAETQARFFARLGAELHNLYGPTEAAVDVTSWKCEPGSGRATVPIGRPVSNTEIHLLDRHMNLLPGGAVGELHIGGVQLARGYLDRPGLTAERFVPHPFSAVPGARLYKTGDLARRLPGGEIEFLGRLDHQVKIRGFRIEPGEIEAVLNQLESVREVVVDVRGEAEKQLVAYVVADADGRPTVSDLLEQVRSRLPAYMVPSAFVFLDEMPLLPNGKINRRALPAPDSKRPNLRQAFTAPLTEVERIIAAVWQQVLRFESVSVHDNFFDLGGHSLLMIQARAKLTDAFGRELPLIDLFRYPTINSLARHLGHGDGAGASRQTSRAEKLGQGKERLRQLKLRRQDVKVRGSQA